MRAHYRFLIVIALTSLPACASFYYVRPGTLQPSTANVAQARRVEVWQNAVNVLLDQGYVPEVLNESAAYISAKRREDIADDNLAGTIALVTVSPNGLVRVQVSGVGYFHSESEFLAAVSERQRLLLDAIARTSDVSSPAAPAPPVAPLAH
jgi:hypothetical protein